MAKPTVVCVPGAWHTPSIYDPVLSILSANGYPTLGISLPSASVDPTPGSDFAADVRATRSYVADFVKDGGKDVVVVAHSYAGLPVYEALKELGERERKVRGLTGGVTRLVFITAFAKPERYRPIDEGMEFLDWIQINKEVRMLCISAVAISKFSTHPLMRGSNTSVVNL